MEETYKCVMVFVKNQSKWPHPSCRDPHYHDLKKALLLLRYIFALNLKEHHTCKDILEDEWIAGRPQDMKSGEV